MSLDGCIADRNGGVDWLYGNSPGEGGGSYESFAAGVDTVIMGRRTYEQVTTELSVGAWPYVGMDCYVLTHRSCEPAPGVVFTAEAPEALIARLKALPGKDIWICGGDGGVHALVGQRAVAGGRIPHLSDPGAARRGNAAIWRAGRYAPAGSDRRIRERRHSRADVCQPGSEHVTSIQNN